MDIVDELFASDEANILTNRAGREIVKLRTKLAEREGWKLVPLVLDRNIIEAIDDELNSQGYETDDDLDIAEIYNRILAAAPQIDEKG